MSELALLIDCLRDVTNERDDLADTLAEKEAVIAALMESLDEAKYDKPQLRAKLDKQRQRIKAIEMTLSRIRVQVIAALTGGDGGR